MHTLTPLTLTLLCLLGVAAYVIYLLWQAYAHVEQQYVATSQELRQQHAEQSYVYRQLAKARGQYAREMVLREVAEEARERAEQLWQARMNFTCYDSFGAALAELCAHAPQFSDIATCPDAIALCVQAQEALDRDRMAREQASTAAHELAVKLQRPRQDDTTTEDAQVAVPGWDVAETGVAQDGQ